MPIKRALLTVALIFVSLLLLNSCFEYKPNQIILDDEEKNLTAKNLAVIQSTVASDTVRFVLMGDTQRFYDESEDFVRSINRLDNIDFVLHAGDISDFGLSQEFEWVHEILADLKVPYLTVIGNHDLLANGKKVYTRMYGELNYSFEFGNYKFIMLNTNSREYGFNGMIPDLKWLAQQLQNNPDNKKIIVVSHVPPFDGDFDNDLEQEYASLLSEDPNVLFSLHGHRHSFEDQEYYDDGIRYFVTTSTQKKGYGLVTLTPDNASIEIVNY